MGEMSDVVRGAAAKESAARELREEEHRRLLSGLRSQVQASEAAEVCSTCVSSSTVSSSLLSTSTQPAPLSDMSFELRGKLYLEWSQDSVTFWLFALSASRPRYRSLRKNVAAFQG